MLLESFEHREGEGVTLTECELDCDARWCATPEIEAYLQELDACSDLIVGNQGLKWGRGFYASDYRTAARHLSWVSRNYDLAGHWFCEWGAGLGGVSTCAASLGMRVFGFEVDGRLVAKAKQLVGSLDLHPQFLTGSFIHNSAEIRQQRSDFRAMDTLEHSAWGRAPVSAEHVRLFYAYPWPGEEDWIYQLFDELAGGEALLFCFHGADEYSLRMRQH